MGLDAASDAGSFEPIKAKFFRLAYPVGDAGGIGPTKVPTAFCNRHYRIVRAWGREQESQAQTKAIGVMYIEIRRDLKTVQIDPGMICQIKGVDFGITEIDPNDFNRAMIKMTIQTVKQTVAGSL